MPPTTPSVASQLAEPKFTTKDAILLAYSNPSFMEDLITFPEKWAAKFQLSRDVVIELKKLDLEEVRKCSALVKDPISFAAATEIIASLPGRVTADYGGGGARPE
jgi:hypothetical protein